VAGLKLPQQERTAAQDDREQMVEIVGDPPGRYDATPKR
jgi:hypothetical protein